MIWSDIDARARGLSTRLVGGGTLRQWAGAADPAAVTAVLFGETREEVTTAPADAQVSPLERQMVALVDARFSLLRRWAGARAGALDALFEDDERRAVRALVRGAVVGIPSSARLDGLIPTPTLPAARLRALVEVASVARLVAELVRQGHPYGLPLLVEARHSHPHLLTLEHCLDRVYTGRVIASARHGDRVLRDHARFVVDAQNCWWAVSLAGLSTPDERAVPARWFLRGGRRLPLSAYEGAIRTASRTAAGALLAGCFPRTPLGSALEAGGSMEALDDAAATTAMAAARMAARADPLGTGPIISYVLRQRGELRDVRRLVWGHALAAPPARLRAELVST